jgi:hypothetical protein
MYRRLWGGAVCMHQCAALPLYNNSAHALHYPAELVHLSRRMLWDSSDHV